MCLGCGSSYSDDFNFCPHCGRAKPEPERVRVEVVSGSVKYEEATLRLVFTGRGEDQIVSKAGRSLLWLKFDDTVLVFFFQLELVSFHPLRNEYIAAVSNVFRDIRLKDKLEIRKYLEKPEYNRPGASGYKADRARWYKRFMDEIKETWTQFNQELIKQGWTGLTSEAIERQMPLLFACLEFKIGEDVFYSDLPKSRQVIDLSAYRYRRLVSD